MKQNRLKTISESLVDEGHLVTPNGDIKAYRSVVKEIMMMDGLIPEEKDRKALVDHINEKFSI